jgi:hypothetical protein
MNIENVKFTSMLYNRPIEIQKLNSLYAKCNTDASGQAKAEIVGYNPAGGKDICICFSSLLMNLQISPTTFFIEPPQAISHTDRTIF